MPDQAHRETSADNSRKLDYIISHIDGGPDTPGILARLALHDEVLFGGKGFGLVTKVGLMWRGHNWLLCVVSGIAGYLLRELLTKPIPKP